MLVIVHPVAVRSIRERILKVRGRNVFTYRRSVAVRSIRERILKVLSNVRRMFAGSGCSEVDPGEDTESWERAIRRPLGVQLQ